jgi:hypothetical protein
VSEDSLRLLDEGLDLVLPMNSERTTTGWGADFTGGRWLTWVSYLGGAKRLGLPR